jgi:hypothetical protein
MDDENKGVNRENIKRFIEAWENEFSDRVKRFNVLFDAYSETCDRMSQPQERVKIQLAPKFQILEEWIRGKGWVTYQDYLHSELHSRDKVKVVFDETGQTFIGAEIAAKIKEVLGGK